MVLCVDPHSGYVVAVPARKKGLLARELAVMMIRHWLTVFDIPRTICSDRGQQFTGGWFKAMCSLMGIRHAKSVAYLSRSNGRAEVAGRQLFGKLRKIHITNPRRNWFEEMWPALKAHHDTPTPGGLSPHQILFGRDPLGRGLPLSGDGMAMDAKEFFARQEATARDIRQQLKKEHAERQKSAPSSTAQKFRVGDPVWVIRPRPMGTHRTKTWFTPGEVVRRIGVPRVHVLRAWHHSAVPVSWPRVVHCLSRRLPFLKHSAKLYAILRPLTSVKRFFRTAARAALQGR